MNVLFVTWDSPEASYLQGLFLPIFRHLAEDGLRFHVLQFCWGDEGATKVAKEACEREGVAYRRARVRRRPRRVGPFLSAAWGSLHVRQAVKELSIDIVMPRSIMPALSVLLSLRWSNFKVLFDADGLAADERVEFAGLSSSSAVYRVLRDIEAQAIRRAEAVLVRSEAARDILASRAGAGISPAKFYVVSNGRDDSVFHPFSSGERAALRESLGLSVNASLLVYAGSIGQQYCMSEMLAICEAVNVQTDDVRFLILTGSPEIAHEQVARYRPTAESLCIIKRVMHTDVPRYLAACDVGLALREPSFSMQAVAPIKLGEYLLCGLPVVGTPGVGDTLPLMNRDVFFPLARGDPQGISSAASWIANDVMVNREAARCAARSEGLARFSLAASVQKYREAIASVCQ